MDLKELTKAMHQFVSNQGWYAAGSARPQTLRNLAISLSLEANEVLEHFQWGEQTTHPDELAGELADVALYLMQIASLAGIDLEDAVLEKLAKNYKRTWDQQPAPEPPAAQNEAQTPNKSQPPNEAQTRNEPLPETLLKSREPLTRPLDAKSPIPLVPGSRGAILENPRPWAFSRGELTAGLRRYTGNFSLTIQELKEIEIPHQRPGNGRLRGLQANCDSGTGSLEYRVVVKEPHGTTRAGTASAGWREISVYTNLADQIPLHTPELLAYHPAGEWLTLSLLDQGKPAEEWSASDYLLAIDQLVLLHDRFWGLGQDLSIYPWLARPLSADLLIYQQAAASGLERLLHHAPNSLFHHDPALIHLLELLVEESGQIAEQLNILPNTLLHGDFWPGNLILRPNQNLYAIDWQRAGIGPGVLDLFHFIQSSLWWFDPLPIQPDVLVERYRAGLASASGQFWSDADWQTQWDDALMWTFLADWLDLLANIPNSILKTRYSQIESIWLEPLRQAVNRRLGS